jgi:hypothetical protein
MEENEVSIIFYVMKKICGNDFNFMKKLVP